MTVSTSATKKCSHRKCEVMVAIPEGKTKRNAVYCSSHVKATTPVVSDAVASDSVTLDKEETVATLPIADQDVPDYVKAAASTLGISRETMEQNMVADHAVHIVAGNVKTQTKGDSPMTEVVEIVSQAVAQTVSATNTNKGETVMNKVNQAKDVVVEKAVNIKDSSKEAFAKVADSKAVSKTTSAVAGVWDFIKNVASDAWGFIRDNGMTALASSVSLVTGVAVGGGFVSSALIALGTYVIISVIVALVKRERLTAEFFAKSVSGGLLFPVFLGMVLPQLTVYGFLATLSFFA